MPGSYQHRVHRCNLVGIMALNTNITPRRSPLWSVWLECVVCVSATVYSSDGAWWHDNDTRSYNHTLRSVKVNGPGSSGNNANLWGADGANVPDPHHPTPPLRHPHLRHPTITLDLPWGRSHRNKASLLKISNLSACDQRGRDIAMYVYRWMWK